MGFFYLDICFQFHQEDRERWMEREKARTFDSCLMHRGGNHGLLYYTPIKKVRIREKFLIYFFNI